MQKHIHTQTNMHNYTQAHTLTCTHAASRDTGGVGGCVMGGCQDGKAKRQPGDDRMGTVAMATWPAQAVLSNW